MLALLLFNADLRTLEERARWPVRRWIVAYRFLLGFLALSTLIGLLLA